MVLCIYQMRSIVHQERSSVNQLPPEAFIQRGDFGPLAPSIFILLNLSEAALDFRVVDRGGKAAGMFFQRIGL